MNCIDRFAEQHPYIYPSGLAILAAVAITALAIGIITLLANNNLMNFSAFHLNTAGSLGLGIPGLFILTGIGALAVRSCIRSCQPQSYQPLNDGEDVYTAPPVDSRLDSEKGEGDETVTPQGPGSLLNPDDNSGKRYGAPGQGGRGDSFTIIRGER